MQPQMAVVLSLAEGTSVVTEGVWDNRYRYVDEIRRIGAQFQVVGKVAVIEGVDHLTGAPVRACDLRAGAAMVIAGLAPTASQRWTASTILSAATRTSYASSPAWAPTSALWSPRRGQAGPGGITK